LPVCFKAAFFAAVLADAAGFTFPFATAAGFAVPFSFAADLEFPLAEGFEVVDLAFASDAFKDFLFGLTAAGFFPESLIEHEALPKDGLTGRFA